MPCSTKTTCFGGSGSSRLSKPAASSHLSKLTTCSPVSDSAVPVLSAISRPRKGGIWHSDLPVSSCSRFRPLYTSVTHVVGSSLNRLGRRRSFSRGDILCVFSSVRKGGRLNHLDVLFGPIY